MLDQTVVYPTETALSNVIKKKDRENVQGDAISPKRIVAANSKYK